MKKHLLFILAALLPLVASAEKVEIDGIWYNLDAGTKQAEVTYKGSSWDAYSNEYSGTINLPATVTYEGVNYSVTSIGVEAFLGCYSLTAITIPEGVTSIGDGTFADCSSLTDITIPEGVTSIGDWAFHYCSSLTTITIPEGVTSIGDLTFYGCSNLTAINIPEGVTSIGNGAFWGCSSLTAITLPESVTSIGNSAFRECSSLTAITIPKGVTSIGEYAFKGCSSLTAINIPEGVTSIGNYAFEDCSNLTSITLPEGVTSIVGNAFAGCSGLTAIIVEEGNEVYDSRNGCNAIIETNSNTLIQGCSTTIIPESVTSIGRNAFADCNSLTAINIPEGVTSIWEFAFSGCSSLTAITCHAVTPPTVGNSFTFYGVDKSIPVYVPEGSVEDYKAAEYWKDFTNIVSMSVPITHITLSQSSATLLVEESLTLTATVAPDNATDKTLTWSSSNPSVATVDNMGKVTAIAPGTATITAIANDGSGVSAQCEVKVTKTAKVEIDGIWYNLMSEGKQAEVTYKGDDPFSYNDYSGSITLPATVTYAGVAYSVTSIGDWAFYGCSSLASITLPEGVTSIGEYAFDNCSSLTAITLPESSTSIERYAFAYCSNLTAINIPEGVTSIGSSVFYNCSSLTSINIPEGVTSIGSSVFQGCSSLTSINIPEGVTSIGSHAFQGCSSLTAINIPEGVTSIGAAAFSSCSNLTAINIPEGVTSIESSAFVDCSSLASINIPEGVTSIGSGAFYNCSSLTTVVLPKSVKSIGWKAFANCAELTDVYCHAETVPSTTADAFEESYPGKATLHVPASAINDFKATAPWSSFGKFETLERNIPVANIILSQSSATLTEGGTLTLTATVTPDDATDKSITWSSSNTSVATVDANGKVTAKAAGTATITATANDGSGVKASCVVTVEKKVVAVSSITLSQSSATLTEGGTLTLTATVTPDDATDKGITWSSSNTSVATVDANGKVTAIAPGTATITATANDGSGVKASCVVTVEKKVVAVSSITLSQSLATLIEGGTLTLTATVTPDDATNKAVTWSSSNTSVVTVDANGKVTAVAPGTATITATANDGSGVKASCVVTVEKKVVAVSSITLSQSSATLTEGETLSLTATVKPTNATNKGITWSSSNTSVATVDANGKVTAIAPGTATITATANDGSGVSATCEVTVVAAEYTITYYVDGEIYHQETLTRGTAIVPIEAPEKEGHTFSGWSEVPATMPAEDITITGTFTVNTYTVTFTIDGVVIASSTQEYGSAITVPSAPTREGYTFSGWGEVPTTMPASDVTYDATYTPNTYKVYYFVGDRLVHVAEVAYGEVIPEYIYEPTTEGDVFMGWIGDTYDTMPAHDVTYTANIANGIENSEINTLNSEFIYDLMGRKVTDTENLRGGIYIIGGKKVIIK